MKKQRERQEFVIWICGLLVGMGFAGIVTDSLGLKTATALLGLVILFFGYRGDIDAWIDKGRQ